VPAAAQRTAGGVFLTFPEDLRPLSAIDYIMYYHSRYVPTSEVGGAEKRLSSGRCQEENGQMTKNINLEV
jgi:hypothetical protein